MSTSLFAPDVPEGFAYRDDFISAGEEAELVAAIGSIEYSTFEMRGVVARRRVAFFGVSYDNNTAPAAPFPEFLVAFRDRAAAWARVEPGAFAMALVNEYRPGAPIGWHRDAPQYGIVAGISLVSSCRMKLRPYVPPSAAVSSPGARRKTTHELELAPRSGYLITGEARQAYEHSIPAVAALRYSVTFRTLRAS
jgi:alkylated DNA repair dioxygenase AlkB